MGLRIYGLKDYFTDLKELRLLGPLKFSVLVQNHDNGDVTLRITLKDGSFGVFR